MMYLKSSWDDPYFDEIKRYLENNIKPTKFTMRNIENSVYGISKIKNVIFNPPATIIFWSDNTKSVVKCQNGESFDPEKGFVLAYLKKLLGNDNTFNKEINKWVKFDEPKKKKAKDRVVIATPNYKDCTFTFTFDNVKIEEFTDETD